MVHTDGYKDDIIIMIIIIILSSSEEKSERTDQIIMVLSINITHLSRNEERESRE